MSIDDEIIEIRYSRLKNILMFAGSIAFVALSFWVAKVDFSDFWNSFWHGVKTERKGYIIPIAILFFGLCSTLYARFIFDRRVQVRINKDGFFWRRWSDTTVPWTEIVSITDSPSFRFGVYFIGLQLRRPEKYKGQGLLGLLGATNKFLSSNDISLTTTNLEKSKKEILVALRSAHKKYSN